MYKCFHPLTHRKFVYQDMTFFESIPFFSSSKTYLQGEALGEELSSSTISLPVLFTLFHFDNNGVSRKETELKVYTRRKKQGDSD